MRNFVSLLLAIVFCHSFHSYAQSPVTRFPFFNSPVTAFAQSGNTLYVAGDFTMAGPNTTYGTNVQLTTSKPNMAFARPNGYVKTVLPDGAGGWYIGGSFSKVGDQVRNNVARLNSDGTVHPWNPDPNAVVNTIARNGNTIFLGGAFTELGGATHERIAAVNGTTGEPVSGWTASANYPVNTFVINGSVLFVGGAFTEMNGQTRNRLASLDLNTGAITTWHPSMNGVINTLAISGSTIYIGGDFTTIGSTTRNRLAAVDINNATDIKTWNPNVTGIVYCLLIDGSTIYAGGTFSTIGTANRTGIAALNNTTGAARTAFNAALTSSGVFSMAMDGSTLYAGGSFSKTVSGGTVSYLAGFNFSTGALVNSSVSTNSTVSAVAISGGQMYAGGAFTSLGMTSLNRLAAVDITSGEIVSFNTVYPNGSISAMAVSDNTLYLSGSFTSVGSSARQRLAAYNLSTGALLSWNPSANGSVASLAISGNTVFAGGSFTTVGTSSRQNLAAINATTGAVTTWQNNTNAQVTTLLSKDNLLYIGGEFSTVGGITRNRVAAADITTAALHSWQPSVTGTGSIVRSIKGAGNNIYIAGNFEQINGEARYALGAVDATSGNLLPWNPIIGGSLTTIEISNGVAYLAGVFNTINSEVRTYLGAVSTTTGAVSSWAPIPTSTVAALYAGNSLIYVGGYFQFLSEMPYLRLAVYPELTTLPVRLTSFNANRTSQGQVRLNWTTSFEQNSSHFRIERSADARQFTTIGKVIAAGESNTLRPYTFIDPSPLSGNNYYRLLQLDRDSSKMYSSVVQVNIKADAALRIFPNPVSGTKMNVELNVPSSGILRQRIIDINGITVWTGNSIQLEKGVQTIGINTSLLSAGIYFLKLEGVVEKQVRFIRP
jgi:trimeric autotransporter adhesin